MTQFSRVSEESTCTRLSCTGKRMHCRSKSFLSDYRWLCWANENIFWRKYCAKHKILHDNTPGAPDRINFLLTGGYEAIWIVRLIEGRMSCMTNEEELTICWHQHDQFQHASPEDAQAGCWCWNGRWPVINIQFNIAKAERRCAHRRLVLWISTNLHRDECLMKNGNSRSIQIIRISQTWRLLPGVYLIRTTFRCAGK